MGDFPTAQCQEPVFKGCRFFTEALHHYHIGRGDEISNFNKHKKGGEIK